MIDRIDHIVLNCRTVDIARLEAAGIPVLAGPAPPSGALGPMTSIYCEDPDGDLRDPVA
jgi:hypothetical protein